MLPDIQPGNTKILYFFNCLLDGMHTIVSLLGRLSLNELNSKILLILFLIYMIIFLADILRESDL